MKIGHAIWSVPPALLVGGGLIYNAARLLGQRRRFAELDAASEQKRAEVKAKLDAAKSAGLSWEGCKAWAAANPELTSGFTPEQLLAMTATELLTLLHESKLSAEYLMRCMCARAMLVDEALNCVTEQDYERAVAEAAACDAELAKNPSAVRGPLHGLPMSVKEQLHMTGFDTTLGACCRLFKPAEEDAALVAAVKKAGAIPFARTNVPQLLMLPESFNAIYGTTNNPFDLGRGAGGSSGGEGAIVGAFASPLGIGTDVGGSIRIPAVLCGICGFKPTVDRLSVKGIGIPRKNERNGQRAIRSCPGPMARSVTDLELFMRVAAAPESVLAAADVLLPPIAWDAQAYTSVASGGRKLRIGYYVSDGWFEAAAPCARAVHEAADAFKAAGHEVVRFEPVELVEVVKTYVGLLAADGKLRSFMEGIEGERLHPNYAFLLKVASYPNWSRPLLSWLLRSFLGEGRKADLVLAGSNKSAYDFWQYTAERDALKKKLLERWAAAGLDVLLCPGLGLPAFPHGMSVLLNQACSYTFVWNNLDMPAGTVPVTVVRPDEQRYDTPGRPDSFDRSAKQAMEGAAGLPVGVQVVAPPWRDELCLGAMAALEAALGGPKRTPPPHARL